MSRYTPWDMREKAGELVKEIIDPASAKAWQRAEQADDIFLRTLELMMRRYSEDKQARLEEAWNEVAKALGFESLLDCHAQGFCVSVNHGRQSIQLRQRLDRDDEGKDAKP